MKSLKESIGKILINGRPLHPDVARICADDIINEFEEQMRLKTKPKGWGDIRVLEYNETVQKMLKLLKGQRRFKKQCIARRD